MSQLFSFSRFRRLFGRHTAEFLPTYLMSVAVLAGGLLVVLAGANYLANESLPVTEQKAFFILFLFAAGSVFTSTVFAPLGDKRQAAAALTLPASHLEKYLVAWLYSLPIFLVVFGAVFSAVDAGVVYGSDWRGQAPQLLNLFSGREKVGGIVLFFAAVHGAGLLGAVWFEKLHFVKTAFVLFILAAGLLAANSQVLHGLLGPGLHFYLALPFGDVSFQEGQEQYYLALPAARQAWLGLAVVAVAALLWRAAYARLTEKQL